MISRKKANLMDRIKMNQQKLQMFMLCLRSIYASMTFNCPLMLNKVGSEKIPLPQEHMLFRFAVYRDSYLDTNPKIAIGFSKAIPTPRVVMFLNLGHQLTKGETCGDGRLGMRNIKWKLTTKLISPDDV